MFLSISAFRPTLITFDPVDSKACTTFFTPLTPQQVADTFAIPGVEVGVLLGPFSQSEDNSEVFTSGDVTIRRQATGSVVTILSRVSPILSMASGLSLVW